MEELSKKQLSIIKAAYNIDKIFFILYIIVSFVIILFFVFWVQLNGDYRLYAYIIFTYFIQLFVISCILFSNGRIRKKLIAISLIIYAVYSFCDTIAIFPIQDQDLPLANRIIDLFIKLIYYVLCLVLFISLYQKSLGKQNFIKNVKAYCIILLPLFISSILFISISEFVLNTISLFSIIVNAILAFCVPLFILLVSIGAIQNEGFYKNFIEAHPESLNETNTKIHQDCCR